MSNFLITASFASPPPPPLSRLRSLTRPELTQVLSPSLLFPRLETLPGHSSPSDFSGGLLFYKRFFLRGSLEVNFISCLCEFERSLKSSVSPTLNLRSASDAELQQ